MQARSTIHSLSRTNKNVSSPNKTEQSYPSKTKAPSIVRATRIAFLKWNTIGRKNLVILLVAATFITSMQILLILPTGTVSSYPHRRIIQITNNYQVGHSIDEAIVSQTYVQEVLQTWLTGAEISHGLEDFEEGNCKAMHDWQVKSYPNCNSIHESDFLSYTHVTAGGWRDVWRANEFNGESYAVKTLLWKGHNFRFRDAERHRRDANAYSMLQGSKHIMNIYGYCVNSASFDFVTEGTLDDMLDNKEVKTWESKHKLRYAWQLTNALSNVHSVGNIHDSAAIAHTDISPDQFLWFDGMFKLNDFNRGRFIRWDSTKHEACPFYIGSSPGINRSPEEYGDDSPLTEKIDVYSLGNLLWQLLTGSTRIFPNSKKKVDIVAAVKAGKVQVDKNFAESLDEKELAVLTAKEMCHRKDPLERSTAMEVEQYLRGKLEQFNIKKY